MPFRAPLHMAWLRMRIGDRVRLLSGWARATVSSFPPLQTVHRVAEGGVRHGHLPCSPRGSSSPDLSSPGKRSQGTAGWL